MCHGFLQCSAYGMVAATRAEAYILIGFIILRKHNIYDLVFTIYNSFT